MCVGETRYDKIKEQIVSFGPNLVYNVYAQQKVYFWYTGKAYFLKFDFVSWSTE